MASISEIPALPFRGQAFLRRVDDSIQAHSSLCVSILLLLGFVIRAWRASGTFLNPDEAMHFQAADQASWWLAYRASLSLAHPPLLVFLLHAWRAVGTSELVLRMPSVISGTLFCWLTYKWASTLFRPAVAWIAFILALFLPSTIDLSIEVRQYALMLAFAMASAYLLERALETNSATAMVFSGVSLWLALGFHYSAFLFAAAMGMYAIVRMFTRRPSPKLFASWEFGQIVALGLGYFFYVTQLSKLTHGEPASSLVYQWTGSYLPSSYFVPGKINPLLFIFARTGGVFQYAFGQMVVGDIAYFLFLVGLILVLRKQEPVRVAPRQLALLLILPFAVNCAAALAAVYPYGGTRHSAFLLPFVFAGIGLAMAHLVNYRLALGISTAIGLVLLCNLFASHREPYISRQDQSITHMQDAMGFIHNQIAAQDVIFADRQTNLMLRFYLCEKSPGMLDLSVKGFRSYDCAGHRIIMPDSSGANVFRPRNFSQEWMALVTNYNFRPGTRIWVTQMGWNTHLATQLEALPGFHLAPHSFGQNIQIFDLKVGDLKVGDLKADDLTVGRAMLDPKLLPAS